MSNSEIKFKKRSIIRCVVPDKEWSLGNFVAVNVAVKKNNKK